MHILFFSHYFPPESNAPASRTYEHALRWVQAGHQVTVITCAPNVPNGKVYDGYKNRLWPQRESVNGIDVLRVFTVIAPNNGKFLRILNYVSYLFSAIFGFLFFCRRPDIIIATSPQFFCGWAGTICSCLKWCPNIVEIRDIWPESIVTVGAMNKGWKIRMLESLERRMYLQANHIIAVGNGYKKNIAGKTGQPEKISVITNGVDTDIFYPQKKSAEFLERWNLDQQFVCSYVGTIGMAHALEVVIRAAHLLKEQGRNDIVFMLIGDGARRSELESIMEKEGLQDWIRFTGRLPREDMPSVLASSDCLLVHLRKKKLFETVIPSKIFEAMAMKRPVVMGVRGEAAGIVRTANSGIDMEPENENDLVEAVTRLADDPEFYQSLCDDSEVAQCYSRNHLAAEYLDIIQAVVDKTAIPASSMPTKL